MASCRYVLYRLHGVGRLMTRDVALQWTVIERGTSAAVAVLATFLLLLLIYKLSPFPALAESPSRMSVRLMPRPLQVPEAIPAPSPRGVAHPRSTRPATAQPSAKAKPKGAAPDTLRGRPEAHSSPEVTLASPSANSGVVGSSISPAGPDTWSGLPSKGAHVSFQRDFLRRDAPTLKELPAGRFRMKREITPQDIVKGASQVLGFWPPGYTDDPCGGIRRSVQQLYMATTPREKTQLADAVRLRQMYCQ